MEDRRKVPASGLYYNCEVLLNHHPISPHLFLLPKGVCMCVWGGEKRQRCRETERHRQKRDRNTQRVSWIFIYLNPESFHFIISLFGACQLDLKLSEVFEREAFHPAQPLIFSLTICVSELKSHRLVPLWAAVLSWEFSASDHKWPCPLFHTEGGLEPCPKSGMEPWLGVYPIGNRQN